MNDTSSHVEIKEFAFQYSILEEHRKTIEILEPIINPEIYTELSRTLLMAYYHAGETGKALKLCQVIRSKNSPIDVIADMQSTIYESIGDLSMAIEVCEEYLDIYPDDQRIQIRLALLYYKIKGK